MIYLTNRDGGKTDEAGHYQFLAAGFNGNVLNGLTLVQTNPLGMKLNLTAGNARIPYGGYAYSAFVQEGETEEVQIGTANPSNPRIDRVVMYIDRAMARQTVNPNNPGIAKIAVVAGTPAGTPVRPSDVSVNAAVGNNPWIDLADVRVNTGVTQITTANVTDKRVMASAVLGPNAVTTAKIADSNVTTAKIADASVTADKIDYTTLKFGNYSLTEEDTGFKWTDGKAIYKRTYTGTHTTNTALTLIASSGIDSLVDCTGWTTFESTVISLGNPRYVNTTSLYYAASVIKVISSGNISLYTIGTSSGSNTHSITLFYTKV